MHVFHQVSSLKSKLKKQSTATGNGVARAFLRAQAALFGSYRDALRYKPVSFIISKGSDTKYQLKTANVNPDRQAGRQTDVPQMWCDLQQ